MRKSESKMWYNTVSFLKKSTLNVLLKIALINFSHFIFFKNTVLNGKILFFSPIYLKVKFIDGKMMIESTI